jgi:hypothetical protein
MPDNLPEILGYIIIGATYLVMIGTQKIGHLFLVRRFVVGLIVEGYRKCLHLRIGEIPDESGGSGGIEPSGQIRPHGNVCPQA